MTKTFTFTPVGLDRFDPKPHQPKPGTQVVKIKAPFGCPNPSRMGFVYIEDAQTGRFYGLACKGSLS